MNIRRPVVALLLAENLIEQVDSGEKRNSVREGHRDYRLGDKLVLVNPEEVWCSEMKTVTAVTQTSIQLMKEEDFKHQGWNSREEVVEDMRGFYPNLTIESPITVVWWE